ncbi:nucleotidyltransferase [Sulfolobus sp. A20]|uniref:nucleotidyltransferase family protein n=1 Tax=Sulfolobaceae TaxID=118883 RepID=UPI0008461C55|nr:MULTISPECIES: nucleotidyltransferase family protein [unclassified Sulfolobus]TRM74872.1 nucleotidyltransferase family protein [Sulfolobus sp. B5]TRM77882.1 nucleotidyltransferase family protein [Sulfolobus sp. A20-N-F8]TRN02185.1 nucleotidyltransferase family protein [Sulfolobus sp. E1]AOL16728.1 nucleotidyltransferase [Sulfolobus sp. A20]TRM97954.1 nucleotidyltransferase family protein [Sulfolobus sp. B1]
MHAVILAGGYGKRLRPLTEDKPKPLIEVAGKPIIEWQIMWLKSYNITSFIILTGYKWDVLVKWVSENERRLGISSYFSIEEEPLGTGGALKKVKKLLEDEDVFLVMNGDIITDLDVSRLKIDRERVVAMALVPLKSPYGIVETKDGKVIDFKEKPILENYWINAGVYLMNSRIFNYLPEKGDMEKLTFPKLAKEELILGVNFSNVYWRSIDTIKDIEEVSEDLIKTNKFSNSK